jgi:putative DNA primase/helicase
MRAARSARRRGEVVRIEDFLERLEGVHGNNGQWHARCPAHDDKQASLTVSVGRNGAILATCWTGCELDAITRGVGVTVRDLFPTSGERELYAPPERVSLASAALPDQREITRYAERLQRSPETLRMLLELKGWKAGTCAVLELGLVGDRITIPLRNPDGTLGNFLRYHPNGNGKGPKMLAESGYPRTPYYWLDDKAELVWIVEGEPDAISVANVGLSVIGAPGASAKAHAEWLDPVRDRDVVVCMDNDDAGRRAAQRWARAASTRGARSVRLVAWGDRPDKYDVGELVRELGDGSRAALLELAKTAPVWDEPVRVTPQAATAPVSDAAIDELEPGQIIMRAATSVRPRRVVWLWRQRIPRGRVGIVFGPPGHGKSTLLALLIAEVTSSSGRVLIASAEDDPETTIVPRLVGAGAELERVTLISTKASDGETNLLLPRDNRALGARFEDHALCLIDPLAAHLGDDVNTWNEQQVRALVLAPLAWHARRHDCAVVAIMHLNKSQGMDALSRISGSGGFGGAARFALLFGSHPDDIGKHESRQVLVHVKASEGPRHPALIYRRGMVLVSSDDDELETPVLELEGESSSITPEQVLAVTDPDEAGAFSDAVEWLQRELADGPKLAKRLLAVARERGDFSERTLRKAKRALRVRSIKEQEGWLWERETST